MEHSSAVDLEPSASMTGNSSITAFDVEANNMHSTADVLQMVEEEVEYREGLIARKETVENNSSGSHLEMALKNIVLLALVPALTVLLFVLVTTCVVLTAQNDDSGFFTLKFLGLVLIPTASYIGCIFIIVSHFLHPEMWSERRQKIMLSSWPALVHYVCILYESSHTKSCGQAVAMLNETSFLMQMAWQVAVAHGVYRYIQLKKPALGRPQVLIRHAICWGTPVLLSAVLAMINSDAYQHDIRSGDTLAPWCGIRGDPSVRGLKAVFVHTRADGSNPSPTRRIDQIESAYSD
jgi:hypothetical protein